MGICIKCGNEAMMICKGSGKHPVCPKCLVTLQSEHGQLLCPACGALIDAK